MWVNIRKENKFPPHPNGGKQFMTFDGEWQTPAFFHIDPNDNQPWWENQYGETIKKQITHWREMYENPVG